MTEPRTHASGEELHSTESQKPTDEPPQSSSPHSQSSQGPDEIIPIPPYDWDDLQSRFSQAMEEKTSEEESVRKEYESLVAVRTKDLDVSAQD